MSTIEEKKIVLSENAARIIKTYEKKGAYLKEISDDKATLEFLNEKESAGEPMPDYSNYTDYTEWKETVQKEVDRAETTLENLEIRMIEVEAYQYYIDNYTDIAE
ncbi:hypothetical protein [Psychrilyobacter sp.]|uniref:hypothetical protein n=1 Tax=Psychrilyobacter sp. TaxID=2586924 RepID=UPI003019D26A